MSYFDYEKQIISLLDNLKMQMLSRPLTLGGVAGSGGGSGGPVGGFVGYLPQTRVSYDLDELAKNTLPASGMSLLDNLNHIRYRVAQLEGGSGVSSGLDVYSDGVEVASGITVIDFLDFVVTEISNGHATVQNKVKITVSGTAPSNPSVGDLWVDIS